MKPHTIDFIEFLNWRRKQRYVYASSTIHRKKLVVGFGTNCPLHFVYYNGDLVIETCNAEIAIDTYNRL